jgi:hypothetical protein
MKLESPEQIAAHRKALLTKRSKRSTERQNKWRAENPEPWKARHRAEGKRHYAKYREFIKAKNLARYHAARGKHGVS